MPPAPFGVTPQGFSRPSVQELLSLIEADQRAEISQTLDLSADSVLGQNNAIIANQLGTAWEALEAVYDGNDPDRAEDDAATSLAKLTGTDREGASKSLLVGAHAVQVTLTSGTLLQASVHFAHVTGRPDVRFTPRVDFTAPTTGNHLVDFESENTGPVQAPATTLNIIATPVVGWSFVINTSDAVPGRTADDDQDLFVRREQALALSGSSGTDQIRADVLAVTNVTSVQVFENINDETDPVTGLPGHSFQVVLWDDAGAANDAVAQAIWGSKPGGIEPIGDQTGTATDRNGDPQVMRFSRAAAVLMYLEFDVIARAGYVGAADFKLAIASALNTDKGTGSAVIRWDLQKAAAPLGADILNVRFGIAPAPTTDTEVAITQLQIARFDTSRILVNGA